MTQPISSAAFRDALAQFASGVTVVTARVAAGPVGFTATGFASASLSPPLILVCIGKDGSAYRAIVGAEHFAVSVLDEAQGWVAMQFARSGIDRFEGVTLAREHSSKAPLIEGALAHIECRRYALHEAGDHAILLGEVLGAVAFQGRPLLHFARRLGTFVPDAQAAVRSATHAPP